MNLRGLVGQRRVASRPPLIALLAGVAILAVPTVYSIFPALALWPWPARLGITFVWMGVAIAGVVAASEHESRVSQLVERTRTTRDDVREVASDAILSALLAGGEPAVPRRYELTVCLYDAEDEVLAPVFPPLQPNEEFRRFSPGVGATGKAWEREETILVFGDAVFGDEYGLSPAQKAAFRDYNVVAATPIRGEVDRKIGVLSAVARRNDGFFGKSGKANPAGVAALRQLADVVGVILDHLWDDGGYDREV